MREEYRADSSLENYTHIDAMMFNIERACQAAIVVAQHLVAVHHLGMPQNSAESFILLEKSDLISKASARSMVGMTRFRNVAIHENQKLDMDILRLITESEYKSLIEFCRELGVRIVVDI